MRRLGNSARDVQGASLPEHLAARRLPFWRSAQSVLGGELLECSLGEEGRTRRTGGVRLI